jgi:hypothetical protein
LQPLRPPVEGDASLPYDILNLRNYSLAVSGDVFRWVIDYAPADVLQRVSHSKVVAAQFDLLINQRCLFVVKYMPECHLMRSMNW